MSPQEESKKSTNIEITWADPFKGTRVLHLNDVKIVYTENIIIIIHGPDKEIIVERKLDVSSLDAWRSV
jgi:hypothetical protein